MNNGKKTEIRQRRTFQGAVEQYSEARRLQQGESRRDSGSGGQSQIRRKKDVPTRGGWPQKEVLMPWTPSTFKKRHNKKLTTAQSRKAAKIADAVLRETGNEGKAIRIANAAVKRGRKKY